MRRSSHITVLVGLLGAMPLLLVGGTSLAGPPPSESTEPAPPSQPPSTGDELPSDRPTVSSVPSLKAKLEAGMAELGVIAEQAKRDGDAIKAACAVDKQERGRAVMEVATGELLVIQDSGSSAQQKAFAVEKLQAAADRMQRLVDESGKCSGDTSPEDEDDVTRNEVDEPTTVPVEDPTQGGGEAPVLPPVDSTFPPTVASPSR